MICRRLTWRDAVRHAPAGVLAACLLASIPSYRAAAQPIDFSQGGPIDISASQTLEWHRDQQQVVARGNARAVRDNVTVTADRLVAWYRRKGATTAPAPAPAPGTTLDSDADTAGNEIYRVQAEGHVHIFTPTDRIQGDVATYDIDQAVLVITGHDLKLTTPNEVLTARDDMEYWSQKHMAVARGDAVVVTKDNRRLSADTLVAYTAAPGNTPATRVATAPQTQTDSLGAASGKLEKVEAFGHVVVRTVTDTVVGDRAVYVPDTGIARLVGQVRITRADNQLAGSEAEVNLKTGISRLLAGNTGRVQGLVMPNSADQATAATPQTRTKR